MLAEKIDNRAAQGLTTFFTFAAYFGLVVLIAGYFLNTSDSRFHTQVYLGLYFPVAALLLLRSGAFYCAWLSNRELQCYTLLLIWFGVSTIWTPYDAIPHILKLLVMLWSLAMVVGMLLDNIRHFNTALCIAVLILAGAALWSLVQYIGVVGSDFYRYRLDRLGVRELNPILVGLVATILMLYCLMMARFAMESWQKAGYLVMALIFSVTLVLSFSRTAFISLLAVVFLYQFFIRNYKFAVTVSVFTILLLGVMVADIGQDWLVNISRSHTLDLRLWGWRQTLQQISEHWILGYGVRAPFSVSWVGTPYEAISPEFYHPHNLFLSIWYQTGIIGLSLMLCMLSLIARKLHTLWFAREIRYFSCIFIFILVACLVDRPALIDRPSHAWLWFWLPLMVALNADKLLRHGSEGDKQNS
jgi:O-antigen ligase